MTSDKPLSAIARLRPATQPRWLRQSLSASGTPRAEFTVWAEEQLRRNVIPAEHRAALLGELRHWLSVVPVSGPVRGGSGERSLGERRSG